MMEFLKKFGSLVRTKRKALHYSQEDLAEKVDIGWWHVPDIEAGKRNLRLRLATCLDIDLNELKVYAKCDENGNYDKKLLK